MGSVGRETDGALVRPHCQGTGLWAGAEGVRPADLDPVDRVAQLVGSCTQACQHKTKRVVGDDLGVVIT